MRTMSNGIVALVLGLASAGSGPACAQVVSGVSEMSMSRLRGNEGSISHVQVAHVFLYEQARTIDLISAQYPQHANELRAMAETMQARFGFPAERAERILETTMGPYYASEARGAEAIVDQQVTGPFTPEDASQFVEEMQRRAGGEVASPIREVLLWMHYYERPVVEMSDGWTTIYSSEGDARAMGIHMEMPVPLSWGAGEGDLPFNLRRWTSQHGTGGLEVTVSVMPFADPSLTLPGVQGLIASGRISDWVLPGLASSGAVALPLDDQPTVRFDSAGEGAYPSGLPRAVRTRSYIIFTEVGTVRIDCQADSAVDVPQWADADFDMLLPLCDWIAGNAVFPDLGR